MVAFLWVIIGREQDVYVRPKHQKKDINTNSTN